MAVSTKQLSRSPISSFLHSLHLLDLDLLQDWPGVSKETFDSKSNLQHRLRCIEWSLYRLFELYDPRLTREKLLPFFPPATSLQSVNLRAALFRQLSELKKDGRLGQNVVLRKTMLDECKGDKFEELVAAFSMLVLKKVRLSRTGDSSKVLRTRSEHLLPLVISHRKAIERDLVKRRELRLKAGKQQQSLEAELSRLTTEESEIRRTKLPKVHSDIDALQRAVRENWIGETAWADAVLFGCPPTPDNRLHFDDGLEDYQSDHDSEDNNPPDVLSDLALRVSAQNTRLAYWQDCLKSLPKSQTLEDRKSSKQPQQDKTISFSRHQNLYSELRSQDHEQDNLSHQHATLLESLERGLKESAKQPKPLLHAQRQVQYNMTTTVMSEEAENQNSFEQEHGHTFPQGDTSSTQRDYDHGSATHSIDHRDELSARSEIYQQAPKTPPCLVADNLSLAERTKLSLAHLACQGSENTKIGESITHPHDNINRPIIAGRTATRLDRSSLLERTRESMSLLSSAFEDSTRRKSGPRKSWHSKSKSVNVLSQTRRLEGAWSEESKAMKTAKDDFDVHADYDSVFRSRPKLAMSPNLSPQRNDLFDEFLEEGMKKLTIEPTL